MKKQKLEPGFKRGMMIFSILGILSGILVIYLLKENRGQTEGILSDSFLRQFQYLDIDSRELFYYLLERRGKWVLILWLTGFGVLAVPCTFICVFWMSFSVCTLLAFSLQKLGGTGILFFGAALLPQAVLYVPAGIFFLYQTYQRKEKRTSGKMRNRLLWIVMLCVFLLGILLESSISPWMITQTLKYLDFF